MVNSYEYFNDISVDMDSCAGNAIKIKRNGFYKRALEIWKRYPKEGHPYQLIGFGKLHILLNDFDSAKMNFFQVLKVYCLNEENIDDPLSSNCLSCIEHLGYCLRVNMDEEAYLDRISGISKSVITHGDRILQSSKEEIIDWTESKNRIKAAIDFLKKENVWCDGFEKIGGLLKI